MDKMSHLKKNASGEKRCFSAELVSLNQNETMDDISLEDRLIFLVKGKIILSSANHVGTIISENSFTYLSAKQYRSSVALEASVLLIIRIQEHISFCSDFDIEDLTRCFEKENYIQRNELYLLEMNPEIRLYIDYIQVCLKKGISNETFYENKVSELLYLLYFFYTKEELSLFFHEVLSLDSKFHFEVMRNSRKCKSVMELAQSLNYSVSGFEKHFKRIFGIPPYKWMLQNKAMIIYDEIRLKKRSFKEICYEYNFSSISHFTNFCKISLGATPSHIRKYGRATIIKPYKVQFPQPMDEIL